MCCVQTGLFSFHAFSERDIQGLCILNRSNFNRTVHPHSTCILLHFWGRSLLMRVSVYRRMKDVCCKDQQNARLTLSDLISNSFLLLPWVFLSHRGWASPCIQAVLMVSLKSLQVSVKSSPVSLGIITVGNDTLFEEHAWSGTTHIKRNCSCRACQEQAVHGGKRDWNNSHSILWVMVSKHV